MLGLSEKGIRFKPFGELIYLRMLGNLFHLSLFSTCKEYPKNESKKFKMPNERPRLFANH